MWLPNLLNMNWACVLHWMFPLNQYLCFIIVINIVTILTTCIMVCKMLFWFTCLENKQTNQHRQWNAIASHTCILFVYFFGSLFIINFNHIYSRIFDCGDSRKLRLQCWCGFRVCRCNRALQVHVKSRVQTTQSSTIIIKSTKRKTRPTKWPWMSWWVPCI